MIKVLLLIPGTFNGSIIAAGEEIELQDRSAKSLVSEGGAKYSNVESATLGVSHEGEKDWQVQAEGKTKVAQSELVKVKKALRDKLTHMDMAKEAKAMGVEFSYDATEDEFINAVVASGKAEALLQL